MYSILSSVSPSCEAVFEVFACCLDLFHVAAELVVYHAVPVCEEYDEVESGLDHVFDFRAADESCADMHHSRQPC